MTRARSGLFRHYRRPIVLAIPAGLVVGAVIGTTLYLSSSGDVRAGDRAAGWLSYTVTLCAGLGAVTAAVATVGAAVAVLLHARQHSERSTAVRPVAADAGLSVAIVAAITVLTTAVASGSGWTGVAASLPAGAALGLVAAACAALTTTAALQSQRPDAGTPPPLR